uniref:Elongator complex protein 1 n=1 Tax=Aceria tosichella TaxID=561515 RepID=A0A6G1SMY3_9ACAR
MKNLHVFQTNKVDVNATIVGHCIDADNGRLLVVTNGFEVYEIQENQLDEAKLVQHELDCQSVGLPATVSHDDVILVDFIVESGSILIVLKRGKFLRIGVSSFSPPSSIIHEHSNTISSVKLSPDQDLIALADTSNEIFILSSDCSIIYSSNALTQNDSVHKPVGVGWGSKETQFFGLDGRPSKERRTEDKIVLDPDELDRVAKIETSDIFKQFRGKQERSTVVDWRGDGQYLATLTYIPETAKHYLKVWNRNLDLQYMSEQLVTMERGLLSWIPNGQYVCCAQRRDDRINEIAMFEKNGMVHQRVTLPTFMPHLYIKDLSWSPDSKILALIVVQFGLTSDSQATSKQMIMLYTMQNFHYYMKYSSYLICDVDQYSLRWNPIHHNILYVSSTNGKCVEYNCNFTVDLCKNDSTVVVVDSNKLLVTPFKICNIPPPMSAVKIELKALVTRLILNSRSLHKSFVLTSDNRLYFNAVKTNDATEDFKISLCIDNEKVRGFTDDLDKSTFICLDDGHTYQNMTPINDNSIVATRQIKTGCEIILLEVSESKIEKRVITSIEDRQIVSVVRDSCQTATNDLILLLEDSSCVQVNLATGHLTTRFQIKTTNERLFVRETQFVERHNVVITLTLDSTLRVNEHAIVSNCCTSFKISENFLIYTNTENMINFIPLERLTTDKLHDELGAWVQPIENGGTLVLVCEDESKVILQMPRGNLEILHPRIMVLLRLTNYIDDCDYVSAMKLARRYRVDLNFICDYMLRCNEKKFYDESLNLFANAIAISDPALLNLFVAELSQEDTIQGRYKSAMMYLPAKVEKLELDQVSTNNRKVNKICSTIQLPPDNHYLQPRLLCLLKQEPRKTGEALLLIHNLPDKDEKEAALKFILYFVSVDQLFLDAISTYNTDIALMVASVSSKDPKEYLALLDSFNSIDNTNLRRYKMDSHIKNYERAFSNLLAYLQDSDDREAIRSQLIELVVSKRIYKHAIKACFDQYVNFIELTSGQCGVEITFSKLYVEVWVKYGEYLLEKRHYLEAGLAYLKSIFVNNLYIRDFDENLLDNVIKCYLLAGEWERCLALIKRFQLSPAKREEVTQKIRANISSQGDFTVSLFLSQLIKDDGIAHQLVTARKWHLAEAIITDESRINMYKAIYPMIQTDSDDIISDLKNDIKSAREHFERFKELILTPQKIERYDLGDCINADSLSTVDGSEATSTTMSGSGMLSKGGKVARSGAPSIKTRASSKSNKSQANKKKKKINLKVGSRHEDMALVMELQKFIEMQKLRQDFVRSLLAYQNEFIPNTGPVIQSDDTNNLLRERYELAQSILESLWPKNDVDDSVFSVYKRFGKLFATGESLDNDEVSLLLRPDFPSSLSLLEL